MELWHDVLNRYIEDNSLHTPSIAETLDIGEDILQQWLQGESLPDNFGQHQILIEELSVKGIDKINEYFQSLGHSLNQLTYHSDEAEILALWLARKMAQFNYVIDDCVTVSHSSDDIIDILFGQRTALHQRERKALAEKFEVDESEVYEVAKAQAEALELDFEEDVDDEKNSESYQESSVETEPEIDHQEDLQEVANDNVEDDVEQPAFEGVDTDALNVDDPELGYKQWFENMMTAFGHDTVASLCNDPRWELSEPSTQKHRQGQLKSFHKKTMGIVAGYAYTTVSYLRDRFNIDKEQQKAASIEPPKVEQATPKAEGDIPKSEPLKETQNTLISNGQGVDISLVSSPGTDKETVTTHRVSIDRPEDLEVSEMTINVSLKLTKKKK